jgi:hypothetical protein
MSAGRQPVGWCFWKMVIAWLTSTKQANPRQIGDEDAERFLMAKQRF